MALKKKSSCSECGKTFPSKAKLVAHAKSHKVGQTGNKKVATRSSAESTIEPGRSTPEDLENEIEINEDKKPVIQKSVESTTVKEKRDEKVHEQGNPEEEGPEENDQEKRKSELKESGEPSKRLKTQHVCKTCSKTFALQKALKRHEETCQAKSSVSPKLESSGTRSSTRQSVSKPISVSDYDFKASDEEIDEEFKGGSVDENSEEFKEQMKDAVPLLSLLVYNTHCSIEELMAMINTQASINAISTESVTPPRIMDDEGVKPNQCEVCKKQFSRKPQLLHHMQQTDCGGTPQTFPCEICGEVFNGNDNLQEHLPTHDDDSIRKRKHTCEHCNKEFDYPSMLTVHMRTHTGEKPFQCELCKKAFPSDGALKKHGRVHSGERPYECKECGSRFSMIGTLNRHMRIHSGIRPHKCQFCPREFIQIGELKAHLFYHTGENGFNCDRCGKCFNRKARLEMHIRYVHEKVKPFTCKECGKAFVRKEDLNRHFVLHIGVKAFQCPTCEKSFAIQASLKLHLLTHRKETPKSCEECGRAFIRQDCLLRHMRKRHRDVLDRLIANVEKKVLPVIKTDVTTVDPLQQQSLEDSIKELLSLLVDEATLNAFGWPDKPVNELLEAVINRCGHSPVNPEDYSYMDRLRENCKLLFTVVIDDTTVKTLLKDHTVDEVILHVVRLAKT